MNQVDGKQTLWANVATLMKLRYGKENMSKLAVDAGVGPATMTRIKEQKTSIGTEKLDQLAKALGVESWQLLCPGFDFTGSAQPANETKQEQQEAGLAVIVRNLADYLAGMDATTRRRAGRLLADLADEPQSHAQITEMLEAAIRSGRPAEAEGSTYAEKNFTLGKRHEPGEKRHGPEGIDRRRQNRREG